MIEDEKVGDEVLMIGAGKARRLRLSFSLSCDSNHILQFLCSPLSPRCSHMPVHSRP